MSNGKWKMTLSKPRFGSWGALIVDRRAIRAGRLMTADSAQVLIEEIDDLSIVSLTLLTSGRRQIEAGQW